MGFSVTDPITPAIEKTKEILFRPFNIAKWMALGFCAFLANLGEGGGSGFNGNFPGGGSGGTTPGGGPNPFDQAWDWVQSNAGIVIAIAVAAFLLMYLIGLLISWLSCRGQFMFIDGIVKNRGAVREPWAQYKSEGNSLFYFKFIVSTAGMLFFLLLAGVCLLIAWGDISSKAISGAGIAAIILFMIPVMIVSVALIIVYMLLSHFVVPTMYLRRVNVWEGWRIVRATFFPHAGTLFVYFIFQIVIGLCVAMAAFALFCITCCLAAIPYVGSVIMLPLFVFMRAYTLMFIEQFGPEWKFFPETPYDGGPDNPEGGGEPAPTTPVAPAPFSDLAQA